MDLSTLKKLFTELRDNLESQRDSSVFNCYKLVKNTVAVLESDESDDFKREYAIDTYKSLYTGRAGLTEYYIWDDDYEKRMKLNEPYERIRNEFWKMMKPYV